MLEPIEKEINGKKFTLSKFPAIEGREISAVYARSSFGNDEDYKINESIMLKLMAYVGVMLPSGMLLRLTTRELVNNHVPNWETLVKIEKEMVEYNCSFLLNGQG